MYSFKVLDDYYLVIDYFYIIHWLLYNSFFHFSFLSTNLDCKDRDHALCLFSLSYNTQHSALHLENLKRSLLIGLSHWLIDRGI